ncbi:MAG: sigma-E processing peptidase SpoIIGA [Clostridia bacterium]|nr:sigma-E processing peptidase SpoIIGA [Clostridia bacterium]
MQTLYADILFLINFTMDFLTLFVTASILHRKPSLSRLCISSAIGGIYGVAAVFMQGILIINIFINLAVSYLMCLIVFPKRTLPCYALFYGTGCLLGGAMTAFFTFMNGVNTDSTESAPLPGKIPLGWMAVSAAVIGVAAIAGGRMTRKKQSLRPCRLAVLSHNGSFVFDAMTDTGNLLTDPMSGKPVILLERKALISLLPSALVPIFENADPNALQDADPTLITSVRLIPSTSVGGDKLLFAYLPKKITVENAEVSALIAMGDENGYGEYAALVPEILIN